MNTQESTPVVHLDAAGIERFARSHGTTDAAMVTRVRSLHAALKAGVDVKTIAADLRVANAADASVPVVSEPTLSRERFALTVAEIVGIPFPKLASSNPTLVADSVRAASRIGSTKVRAGIRMALKNLGDDATPGDRESIVVTTIATALATGLTVKPRSEATRPGAAEAHVEPLETSEREALEDGKPSGFDAVASIRAVTAWLARGGEYSADLASAGAEFAAAMATARKRTKVAA